MIASINDDDNSDVETLRPRRRRTHRDNSPETLPLQNAAVNMLQNLNNSKTVASIILDDQNEYKIDSIRKLASHSVAARKLITPLEQKTRDIKLNRAETVDVLKLMSNIFDNTISVVITE
jgi:hypothetical protein